MAEREGKSVMFQGAHGDGDTKRSGAHNAGPGTPRTKLGHGHGNGHRQSSISTSNGGFEITTSRPHSSTSSFTDARALTVHSSKRTDIGDASIIQAGRITNPVFTDADPFWNKTWGVVNPRHGLIQAWDLNTLVLLVFTCIVTPYEIAFLDGAKGVNVEILFYVNQYINVIFVIDMVLVFFLPFEGGNGCWVTNKSELALAYFRRMFVVDAISVIPFDVVAALQDEDDLGDLKFFRVLKLFRLLKMLRIFRGLRIVKRYETDYAIDYQALNISSLLICLLGTAHWIACLLAMICKYDSSSPDLPDFFPVRSGGTLTISHARFLSTTLMNQLLRLSSYSTATTTFFFS